VLLTVEEICVHNTIPGKGLGRLEHILMSLVSLRSFPPAAVGLGGSESVKLETTLRDLGGEVTTP